MRRKATAGTDADHARRSSVRAPRSRPVMALLVTLVLLAAAYCAALAFLRPPAPGGEMRLGDLQRRIVAGEIASARLLDEDARVVGRLKGGSEFWASYPRSDTATNDLLKTFFDAGTPVSVDTQVGKATVRFVAQFLLPLVILANLFALLFYATRSGGGGASDFVVFSRLGDKRLRGQAKDSVGFDKVAGAEEAVAELAEVRDYLADPAAFKAMGALPPKGVLLVGPPGCGKTLLARAVAGEARASFFSISGSEFVESLVGVGAARVRDLFAQARAHAPAIIFIDELDGAGRQRGAGLGGGHDEREQTLNELLVQIDGFSPTEGVVVIGATNRPDILDPALTRAGRFDRRITVETPDAAGRLAILGLHARGRRLADPDADLVAIARRTPGFTGADLANVVNEAALLAVRQRSHAVERHHLEEAVERVLNGPRRATRVIPAADKHRIAVHEAGHTVVAAAMGKADSVDKVSVVARGGGVGHLALLDEDRAVRTRADMEAEVTIAMAGIAAEELVLGMPSTGSEEDLKRATNTARDMAGRFGMSPRLGRVRVLHDHGEVFLGRDYLASQDVSQPTLEHLDAEVRRILDEQEHIAHTVLAGHRDALERLVSALVRDETVRGTALAGILTAIRPYERPAPTGNGNGTSTRPRATSAGSGRARRTRGDDLSA